jgi:tetratricopeptide (TPR) repeat protein
LPSEQNSAFEALDRLKNELAANEYFERENELRVALEDRAQRLLLVYLSGDQTPQTRTDFDLGSRYMAAARRLTRESLYLEGREDFFQGRTLLFDKNYPQATNLLERAVRIDPGAGYTYNALGIGYLEQADYTDAIHAFRDAAHLSPYWAYPLHNLALAYTQIGDYTGALRAYRTGMDLAPQYAYLPYNAGLLYQRLNKRKEAEASYLKAMKVAPDLAEPYNALGYLRESEDLYRQALQKNADLLAARHNLAVLIFRQHDRTDEAIGLWRANLAKESDYLPSRLSLAKGLAELGRADEAIREYSAAIVARPDYVAVRLALADLYGKEQNLDEAVGQLRRALESQPSNPVVLEQLGDLEVRLGRNIDAVDLYTEALSNSSQGPSRKRIRSKIKMATR